MTRARLVYGPAPGKTLAEIHDERDHPEDRNRPGHAAWEREHRFGGVMPRGNPFGG